MSHVLIEQKGLVGYITLDRPSALNSLTHDMIQAIQLGLDAHIANNDVAVIVINSTSERAFCAGGDMKVTRLMAIDQQWDELQHFFEEEYALNLAISMCPKPYVSFIEGIAMGGGLGLSVHGSVSIVSESAKLAMPETAIGFFPDVGGTYFLSRAPYEAGLWLALTGQMVRGVEAVGVGLATHHIAKDRWAELIHAMEEQGVEALDSLLDKLSSNSLSDSFKQTLEQRKLWFTEPDLISLVAALQKASKTNKDAEKLLKRVNSNSPYAMNCTRQLLIDAKMQSDLKTCLQLELAAADQIVRHPDFIEGVRAVLVDKDKANWVSQV